MEKNQTTKQNKEAVEKQRQMNIDRMNNLNMQIKDLEMQKIQYERMSRKIRQLIEKLRTVVSWINQTNSYLNIAYKSDTAEKKKKKINKVANDIEAKISSLQSSIGEVEQKVLNLNYLISIKEYERSHIMI